MKNGKLRRLGSLLALLLVLTCLLSMSAFAGEGEEPENLTGRWGYDNLDKMAATLLGDVEEEAIQAFTVNLQKAYEILKNAVAAKADEVTIDANLKLTVDDLYYASRMVVADYPEYYWFTGDIQYWGLENAITKVVLGEYESEGETRGYTHVDDEEAALFAEKAAILRAEISEEDSDYEKVLKIHDALAEHIEYDLARGEEQSAYSAIAEGVGVCAGYARAYQYLLSQEGIKAWTVEGTSVDPKTGDGVPHAWNLVWLDGNCFYTDVTWDDQGDQLFHAYFNTPLEEIYDTKEQTGDHVHYGYMILPECDHHPSDIKDVNYFVQEQDREKGMIAITDSTTANDFVEAMVKIGDTFVVDTWCISNEFDDVSEWLNHDADQDGYPIASDILGEMKDVFADDPLVLEHFEWNFGFSILGNEVKVTIQVSPYDGLRDYEGYVDTIEDGKLHAYISYRGVDKIAIKTTYETVMVAYYSEDDALQEVAFTSIKTDGNRRAELTADCPDEFAYCRVFVVGSKDNPAPVCNLLQMSMPK